MTQTLTGQDIGQASYAVRAVLDRVLERTGTGFRPWVAVNVLGSNGSQLDEGDLLARIVHGLKITEPEAREVLADVLDQGLAERSAATQLSLTPAGTTRFQQLTAAITQITERLYGGLPADELAAAHRMLTAVTARANAELDAQR